MFISGDIPTESIVFSVPVLDTNSPIFFNHALKTNELVVLPEGSEVDFLSSCPQGMITVSIERDLANRYTIGLLGQEIESLCKNDQVLKFKNHYARKKLVGRLNKTLELALSPTYDLKDIKFQQLIEERAISFLLSNISISEYQSFRTERLKAARRAKEYMIENKNKQVSMLDICEAVGSTKRTIHMGFKELYGITPKTFLKHIRLNHVRKELSQAKPGTTVTDAAYKWKFYHLSRFARNYYEMFEEYPSETLKHCLNHSFFQI